MIAPFYIYPISTSNINGDSMPSESTPQKRPAPADSDDPTRKKVSKKKKFIREGIFNIMIFKSLDSHCKTRRIGKSNP